jgi:hypothetical protein
LQLHPIERSDDSGSHQVARFLCCWSVVRQNTVQQDELAGHFRELSTLHIERGFGRRDQQSKHKSGHRSNESHSELYNILGVASYVILRQRSAKEYPEKRTTKNDRERQEADRNGTHNPPFDKVASLILAVMIHP